ncbi:MAG: phosphoglucosamine mutase [Pseudomonadota bacterium]
MITRQLFGTDGVRGIANVPPMTVEVALGVGRATGLLVRERGLDSWRRTAGARRRVVIGKDTRLSGYMLENAFAAGLMSMGTDVIFVGPLPTPGVAFVTRSMRANAGVMISASHNPFEDNGIKIFAGDGFKLPDETELAIEQLIRDGNVDKVRPRGGAIGKAKRIDDAGGRYIVFLKNTFPDHLSLDGLRIVVDCANGASYKVAPTVFEELGAEVHPLSVQPDGRNINRRCGSLHPSVMCREVKRRQAHIGIALDGDADRVIVSDENGEVVDGDQIMAICARELMRRGRLAHGTLVSTVMSNIGLERSLAEVGGRVVRTAVGDRYVVERMRQDGYTFGGEQSGHLIFLDHATTGDGVLAALSLLAVMVEQQRPLSELRKCMELFPQTLINLQVREKKPLEELTEAGRVVREVEQRLGQGGRVLVRYSGTEKKARVLVEGEDAVLVERCAEDIAEALRREIG